MRYNSNAFIDGSNALSMNRRYSNVSYLENAPYPSASSRLHHVPAKCEPAEKQPYRYVVSAPEAPSWGHTIAMSVFLTLFTYGAILLSAL